MCSGPFMRRNDEPTQSAKIEPTRYWPWPPMLKRPQRKPTETARPAEHERGRQQERLLQVRRGERAVGAAHPREEPVEPAAVEDRAVGRERVRARREHDEPADREARTRRSAAGRRGRRRAVRARAASRRRRSARSSGSSPSTGAATASCTACRRRRAARSGRSTPATAISVSTYGSAWKSVAAEPEYAGSRYASAVEKPKRSAAPNAPNGRQLPKIIAASAMKPRPAVMLSVNAPPPKPIER